MAVADAFGVDPRALNALTDGLTAQRVPASESGASGDARLERRMFLLARIVSILRPAPSSLDLKLEVAEELSRYVRDNAQSSDMPRFREMMENFLNGLKQKA